MDCLENNIFAFQNENSLPLEAIKTSILFPKELHNYALQSMCLNNKHNIALLKSIWSIKRSCTLKVLLWDCFKMTVHSLFPNCLSSLYRRYRICCKLPTYNTSESFLGFALCQLGCHDPTFIGLSKQKK